jgi:hypothetical protein
MLVTICTFLIRYTYSALNILRPLVDDVTTSVSLNKSTRRSANSTAHVSDEEPSLGLSSDLVRDGSEKGPVAVGKLGVVGVRHVPVEGGVLGLEQRQETASD